MRERLVLFAILIVLGAGWGATQPLAKIAVSGGYRHFGIIFWQMLIGAVVLGALILPRRVKPRFGRAQILFCTWIAVIGTLLPNTASYEAAIHLPSGVLSILIAAVPMAAFPIALALRIDAFSWPRLTGLVLGLIGVGLLVAPQSLPSIGSAGWVLIGVIAPVLYAVEGNSVAKLGTFGLDAVAVLFGASVIGTVLALPLALATGTWITPGLPLSGPDLAVIASSVIHALVYSTYVWMVGRAGPVFAGQVSYLVTGFGVLFAIIFLGETYTGAVWLAMLIMLGGLFLVQPRKTQEVVAQG